MTLSSSFTQNENVQTKREDIISQLRLFSVKATEREELIYRSKKYTLTNRKNKMDTRSTS